jgi:plastocyanin
MLGCGMQVAEAQEHLMHNMRIDAGGAVMHENRSALPRGCEAISRDYEITVVTSTQYAADSPGQIFGMSQTAISVEPCSRIEVTFVNEDQVRHQWMVHGLPRYLYPAGMFHIEAEGGQTRTGSFIVPGEDQTYLIHCDMAQHMEKGMRGQLVVGRGSSDLWQISGVSDTLLRDDYVGGVFRWPVDVLAIGLGCLLVLVLWSRYRG